MILWRGIDDKCGSMNVQVRQVVVSFVSRPLASLSFAHTCILSVIFSRIHPLLLQWLLSRWDRECNPDAVRTHCCALARLVASPGVLHTQEERKNAFPYEITKIAKIFVQKSSVPDSLYVDSSREISVGRNAAYGSGLLHPLPTSRPRSAMICSAMLCYALPAVSGAVAALDGPASSHSKNKAGGTSTLFVLEFYMQSRFMTRWPAFSLRSLKAIWYREHNLWTYSYLFHGTRSSVLFFQVSSAKSDAPSTPILPRGASPATRFGLHGASMFAWSGCVRTILLVLIATRYLVTSYRAEVLHATNNKHAFRFFVCFPLLFLSRKNVASNFTGLYTW